jgi:hypothetical protein
MSHRLSLFFYIAVHYQLDIYYLNVITMEDLLWHDMAVLAVSVIVG